MQATEHGLSSRPRPRCCPRLQRLELIAAWLRTSSPGSSPHSTASRIFSQHVQPMKPDPRLNHMLSGNTHETLVDLGCMLFHVCSPFAREKAENTMKHLKKHTKGVKHVNIKRNNEKNYKHTLRNFSSLKGASFAFFFCLGSWTFFLTSLSVWNAESRRKDSTSSSAFVCAVLRQPNKRSMVNSEMRSFPLCHGVNSSSATPELKSQQNLLAARIVIIF